MFASYHLCDFAPHPSTDEGGCDFVLCYEGGGVAIEKNQYKLVIQIESNFMINNKQSYFIIAKN